MTFRIRRYDSRNWIIEELNQGGLNPKTKEQTSPKWKSIGYYGKLKDLAACLLDKLIILPDDTNGKQILDAIYKTETKFREILDEFAESLNENK